MPQSLGAMATELALKALSKQAMLSVGGEEPDNKPAHAGAHIDRPGGQRVHAKGTNEMKITKEELNKIINEEIDLYKNQQIDQEQLDEGLQDTAKALAVALMVTVMGPQGAMAGGVPTQVTQTGDPAEAEEALNNATNLIGQAIKALGADKNPEAMQKVQDMVDDLDLNGEEGGSGEMGTEANEMKITKEELNKIIEEEIGALAEIIAIDPETGERLPGGMDDVEAQMSRETDAKNMLKYIERIDTKKEYAQVVAAILSHAPAGKVDLQRLILKAVFAELGMSVTFKPEKS